MSKQQNEQVRAWILRLIAEANAGKVTDEDLRLAATAAVEAGAF
jgi:hypothetical protein